MLKKTIIILSAIFATVTANIYGQTTKSSASADILGQQFNPIQTTVPFLTIAPDSRAAGMGDAGVASDPDVSSQHWNAAKYVFMRDKMGIGISYIPWLRNLQINDINLAYMSGYYKFDKLQAISASLRYFSLGSMTFTSESNQIIGMANPNEFALDVAYSRLFGEHFSGALTFRYIRSDLGKAYISSLGDTKAGNALAADIAMYYTNDIELGDKKSNFALGFNLSNLGNKISYTDASQKQFIPTMLRIGGKLKTHIDEYNSIALNVDLIKYLVPTPPIYSVTTPGEPRIILPGDGMDPNVPPIAGVLQSFHDAPGGFKEEMKEVMISSGLEYGYAEQFFVRAGYFHENQFKGNRKYYTMGFGLKYNVFTLDFAYMVPVGGRTSPLANTVRFSLGFILGSQKTGRR